MGEKTKQRMREFCENVVQSGVDVNGFKAMLRSNTAIELIVTGLKMILVGLGQWDELIEWLMDLKDKIPGAVDDMVILALIEWLEEL